MADSFARAFAFEATVPSPVLVAESGRGIRSPFGGGAARRHRLLLAGGCGCRVITAARQILAEETSVFRRWDAGESYLAGAGLQELPRSAK